MNSIARRIGATFISVMMIASQSVGFADDAEKNNNITAAAPQEESAVDCAIALDEEELNVTITGSVAVITSEKDEVETDKSQSNDEVDVQENEDSIIKEESEVAEVEEVVEVVEVIESEEVYENTSLDELDITDNSEVIEVTEETTGVKEMESIDSTALKINGIPTESLIDPLAINNEEIGEVLSTEESTTLTGSAAVIEILPIPEVVPQYVERIERVEIENFAETMNMNMSYSTVDYKKLDIKVSYDIQLDIDAEQIEVEDSFFGKTILNKTDGVYSGESSKIVGFDEVMQSMTVRAFYNIIIIEEVIPEASLEEKQSETQVNVQPEVQAEVSSDL